MVELPGHGTSPLPDPFSLEAVADAVDSVIALQKPESTIVVGQGVGGMIAVQALARHPGHARGLVLIDAQMKSPVPVDDQMVTQLVRFMDTNYDTFSRMVFTGMGRDSAEKELLLAKAANVPPATVKAYFRTLLLADANRQLKSLGFPVRMVVTERLWPAGELWGPLSKKMGMDDSTSVEPRRVAKTGAFIVKDQPDTLAAILSEYAVERFAAKK
jgi:pimeloyl-ACP methyl ester carboxylesterase